VGADEATAPTVTFEVWADGQKRWESGLMQRGMAAKRVDLDMTGVKTLMLANGDGGDGNAADHADWAEAVLVR
jgi:beta-galactosidase